jgi:predicted nucleic acid-binding protein
MVCLDSDVLIAFMKGDADATEAVSASKDRGPLRTTVINEYELLKGASSSKGRENLAVVKGLLSAIEVLALDDDSCEVAAGLYNELRAEEKTTGEFDLLIAAVALRNKEALVTRDGHFKRIPGLELPGW